MAKKWTVASASLDLLNLYTAVIPCSARVIPFSQWETGLTVAHVKMFILSPDRDYARDIKGTFETTIKRQLCRFAKKDLVSGFTFPERKIYWKRWFITPYGKAVLGRRNKK